MKHLITVPSLIAATLLLVNLGYLPVYSQAEEIDTPLLSQESSTQEIAQAPEQSQEIKQELFADLGLSSDQQQKVNAILQSKGEHKQEREQLRTKRQQLMEMIRQGSGSKEEAITLHRELSQQQSALMEKKIGTMYDLKAVLTPEQYQKLGEKIRQHKGHKFGGRYKNREAQR